MSAPTSGSADGGPAPGYYPDPSIPGYIRYWNGASWVPGTSRPAPGEGDAMPAPPPGAGPGPSAAVPAAPAASPSASTPPSSSPRSSASPSGGNSVPAQDRTGPMYFDEIAGAAAARSAGEDGPGAAPREESAAGPAPEPEPGPGDRPAPGDPRRPGGREEADGPRRAGGDPRAAAPDAAPAASATGGPEPSGGPTLGLGSGRGPDARRPGTGGPTLGLGPGRSGPGTAPDGDDEEAGGPPSATAAREGTMTLRASGPAGRSRTPGPADPRAAHGAPAAAPGGRDDRPAPGRVPDQGGGQAPGAPAAGADPRRGAVPRPAGEGAPGESAPGAPGAGAAAAQPPADGSGLPVRTPGGPAPGPAPRGPKPHGPDPQGPQRRAPGPEGPVQRPALPDTRPGQPSPTASPQPAPAAGAVPPRQPAAGSAGPAASWPQQVQQLAQPGGPAAAADEGAVTPWRPPVEDPFLAAVRAQTAARPAGLGRRLLARLIDTAVLGALLSAAAVPLGVRTADHIDAKIENAELTGETVTVWLLDGTTAGYLGMFLAALLLLGAVYEVLPTARWGRTLGKRLCGVRVMGIESHENPSFAESLRRWLVYSLLGLLVVGVVNVLWCFVDRPWRQCWHDKAARTFVASGG
ncbi:RDD family protein [Streptomyces xinghaiensis]|uniref:RDD family protein n=1 Tax=Streptomyces xinghaiensis TaxID=1038928 RepID=UPI00378FCE17